MIGTLVPRGFVAYGCIAAAAGAGWLLAELAGVDPRFLDGDGVNWLVYTHALVLAVTFTRTPSGYWVPAVAPTPRRVDAARSLVAFAGITGFLATIVAVAAAVRTPDDEVTVQAFDVAGAAILFLTASYVAVLWAFREQLRLLPNRQPSANPSDRTSLARGTRSRVPEGCNAMRADERETSAQGARWLWTPMLCALIVVGGLAWHPSFSGGGMIGAAAWLLTNRLRRSARGTWALLVLVAPAALFVGQLAGLLGYGLGVVALALSRGPRWPKT